MFERSSCSAPKQLIGGIPLVILAGKVRTYRSGQEEGSAVAREWGYDVVGSASP